MALAADFIITLMQPFFCRGCPKKNDAGVLSFDDKGAAAKFVSALLLRLRFCAVESQTLIRPIGANASRTVDQTGLAWSLFIDWDFLVARKYLI